MGVNQRHRLLVVYKFQFVFLKAEINYATRTSKKLLCWIVSLIVAGKYHFSLLHNWDAFLWNNAASVCALLLNLSLLQTNVFWVFTTLFKSWVWLQDIFSIISVMSRSSWCFDCNLLHPQVFAFPSVSPFYSPRFIWPVLLTALGTDDTSCSGVGKQVLLLKKREIPLVTS